MYLLDICVCYSIFLILGTFTAHNSPREAPELA